MNKRQQTVMSKLRPKVKAFGFSKNVLKSIAAEIADKLDIEEEASDEDVNAKIDEAINAVLPYLPLIQSQANSQFDEWKKANTPNDDDDDDSDLDDETKPSNSNKSKGKKADDIPAWAKELIESNKSLSEQLSAMTGEKVADVRRSKLEKLLKGTKSFGESKLRDFRRMKFDNDDEFDEFFSEVEEDLKVFNQERANAGLEKLGSPAIGSNAPKKDEKPEVLSEEEVKAIAKM